MWEFDFLDVLDKVCVQTLSRITPWQRNIQATTNIKSTVVSKRQTDAFEVHAVLERQSRFNHNATLNILDLVAVV